MVTSEPAFQRGEEWAAPAREIALKRYDEPTIIVLTVLLILGLHHFGTCHGGRSWMFGGMALRMAYALQLHQELDHDPLGQNNDKQTELNPTDREIRRRTMWACFLMDRFNSSGTERPPFASEDTIKIQLPIKESYFQMEIPGPTESLDGKVPNLVAADTGEMSDPRNNMGVCAYLVRTIALWGRVVKYLNLGGKQQDCHKCWDPLSGFTALSKEAENFRAALPSDLQYNPDNLKSHAAEKLANQFILLHIAINQIFLFLHRWSIPTAPSNAGIPKDAPPAFVKNAGHIAIEASNQISTLLDEALNYSVYAPFAGYCAFMSGAVHVWGLFSKKGPLEVSSKANIARNIKYLYKMKNYWGMFHYIVQNLKAIYRRHADALLGTEAKEGAQDATIFQYGDWFTKYPHGVSQTDYEDPATKVKKESISDSSIGQGSDLQSVEDFFHTISHSTRVAPQAKPSRKPPNEGGDNASQPEPRPQQAAKLNHEQDVSQHHQNHVPPPIVPPSSAITQSPISPSNFSSQQTLYTPSHPAFPPSYDMVPMSPMPVNGFFPQQLDRHLLYGGYTGADPTSASTLNGLPDPSDLDPALQVTPGANGIWGGMNGMNIQQQQIMAYPEAYGDLATNAWFLPFNLDPPDMGGKMNYEDYMPDGSVDGMGQMRQQ